MVISEKKYECVIEPSYSKSNWAYYNLAGHSIKMRVLSAQSKNYSRVGSCDGERKKCM